MPNYDFECDNCGSVVEVYRPISESGDPEQCGYCDSRMRRIYTTQTNVRSHGYFNHGLGQYVRSSADVRDAMKRIRDGYSSEHVNSHGERYKVHHEGPDLVPVGDDKPSSYTGKKRQGYSFTAGQEREMGKMLRSFDG